LHSPDGLVHPAQVGEGEGLGAERRGGGVLEHNIAATAINFARLNAW
jgi:hypothetical protein